MEKLEKLEEELQHICYELADAKNPEADIPLSYEQVKELEKRKESLKTQIENLYVEMLDKLEKENPDVLKNNKVRELYDEHVKSNYLIFSFLMKYPEIYESTYIANEVGKFIYNGSNPRTKKDVDPIRVSKKIEILDKIQPTFYHYTDFLKFLNNFRFDYLCSYFQSETMMNNPRFIQILLSIVQNPRRNIGHMEYHYVTPFAETALNEELDIKFVYALGNEKKYKDYLISHYKEELFDLISSIHDDELKKKLLVDIFGIKNTKYFHILVKFFAIPEIQKQLLYEQSFYYKLLIDPLTHEDINELDGEDYGGYASIREVVEFHSEDFYDENLFDRIIHHFDKYDENFFDRIIHHFDKYVGNYIYFYYENDVKKVSILSYIQTIRRKIKLWECLRSFISGVNTDDIEKLSDAFGEYFHEYLDECFADLAVESLIENIGRYLSKEEEDYWDHLLNEANNYQEQEDESILLELKSTI